MDLLATTVAFNKQHISNSSSRKIFTYRSLGFYLAYASCLLVRYFLADINYSNVRKVMVTPMANKPAIAIRRYSWPPYFLNR
jgi:hypothetical protein